LQGTKVKTGKKIQTWVECGKEGTHCRFKGTRQVRFGAHKMYSYKKATNGIDCTTKMLGDPLSGFAKKCWYLGKPKKEVKYTHWLRCASEGGMCRFKGKRQVKYGSPRMEHVKKALVYAYKTLEDGTACDSHTLDPAHSQASKGRKKACWFLASEADIKKYAKYSKEPKPSPYHWVPCGLEGGKCVFQGKKQLRYGAERKFAYTTKVGGAPCSDKTFGKLDTGDFFKRCWYLAKRGADFKKGLKKTGLSWRWKKCADEGGRCKALEKGGETMVRFGGAGVFSYQDVKGSIKCSDKSFGGNPMPKGNKSKKACYFKQQVGPKVDENGCRPDQVVQNVQVDKDHPYGHTCVNKVSKKKPVKKKAKKVLQKKKAVKKAGKRSQVHPNAN